MMRWIRSVIAWIKNLFSKRTMRRKINLYIGDQLVDLDDQSFILFNYQMDDLSNPTIVKNSFSQQITLKGTPRNNRVFGHYFRLDRRTINSGGETGVEFAALKKTGFTIYNEMGDVVESGYMKLDSISRDGVDIQYNVTLYGGLGSFFYSLSYNADGSKKTLADLDFLGGGDTELDFTINAATVREAWNALRNGTAEGTKWSVINFFPAYEGFPENFDAKHALSTPASVGLSPSQTGSDGQTYTPDSSGYCLVNLPNNYDQWAVKDLRSYLQRPAWNMKALLTAISNPNNNGGYTFDWSGIENGVPISPWDKWVTRPLLGSLGGFKQTQGNLTTSYSSISSGTPVTVTINGVSSLAQGTKLNASLSMRWEMTASGSDPLALVEGLGQNFFPLSLYNHTVVFFQAVGYNTNDIPVAGGPVQVASGPICGQFYAADSLAEFCGYRPVYGDSMGSVVDGHFELSSGSRFVFSNPISLTVEGYEIAKVKVHVAIYDLEIRYKKSTVNIHDCNSVTPFTATLYRGMTGVSASAGALSEVATSVTYTDPQSLRSGAKITKRMILSTAHTPAEYLLAYAKIFGLSFLYDPAERSVSLVKRNDLYIDETIDLSGRVDTSRPVKIVPMSFSARWYEFRQEVVEGAFAQEYKDNYGRDYGMMRVNTGYDFDASTTDLLSGIALRTAVNVLEHGPYWYNMTEGGSFRPSPFIDPGISYVLYNAGKPETFDVPMLGPSTVLDPYNEYFPGYDSQSSARYIHDKLQFHDSSRKSVDGADVFAAFIANIPSHCKLTDDVPAMNTLNGGTPCWILDPPSEIQYIPQLSRYDVETGLFLDFGEPAELDIPAINYDPDDTIYSRLWQKYIADHYDKDTKVMTCRVDFSGMQVNQGLLRKFYWYENSLWVLNKITNYSLTTYDPVECEFVQVQDKDNYLNGQIYG